MKRISHTTFYDYPGRMGRIATLLLTLCLPLALVSCGSSSSPPPPAVDARLNQHLAYQPVRAASTLKPYQTAVLNLPTKQNDHGDNTLGAGYHDFPYEIVNAGNYKYCIPDDDSHLTAVELHDSVGAQVAAWKKGEPCDSVPLAPGRYTMHVHLDTSESEPVIFLKPHDVEVTQTGVMSAMSNRAVSAAQVAISASQFPNLKVDTLSDIVSNNTSRGVNEGWGIGSSPSSYLELKEPQIFNLHIPCFGFNCWPPSSSSTLASPHPVATVSRLSMADLFYINQETGGKVSLLQGSKPVGLFDGIDPYKPGSVIGLMPAGSVASSFSFQASGTGFSLNCSSGSGLPVVWGSDDVWTCNLSSSPVVDFQVRVRYGIEGPLGWWRLDEGAGTTAADFSSGNGNIGTLTNPVWSADHPPSVNQGNSLDFSGGGTTFTAPIPTTNTSNIGISAWVKWNGHTGANQMIAYNGNTAASGYGLYLNTSGNLMVLIGGVAYVTTNATLTPNVWQQVKAVENGSGNWTIYLNGNQVGTGIAHPNAPGSGDRMLIGGNSNGFEHFYGLIDDVRVFMEPPGIPLMLANEVALFDGPLGPSGFPAGTHYWIINADMKDFSDLSFDNPTNRIKTVIAGRGVRAQLFEKPNFQGASFYASPPVNGEMAMTATDNDLLSKGAIGSIRIEPNTNDIPVYEYSHHIIASANTCIGCDLRGFDASKMIIVIPPYYTEAFVPADLNFKDSDLSYSKFTTDFRFGFFPPKTEIASANFENVNFTGANFTNAYFSNSLLKGTDFTKAVLTNAEFSASTLDTALYNSCPKFEYTDLTSLYIGAKFDDAFPRGVYDAADWWTRQRKVCRTSLAGSKVSADLFSDKRLWQFVGAPGVDFSGMNLDGYNFAGSNLRGAIFKNASLKGIVFVTANLTRADFTGADLTGAHLEGATLDGAIWSTLEGDKLIKATLSRAILSGVTLKSPNLSGLDMSGAQLKGGQYTNWDGHAFEPFNAASLNGAYMYNTKLNGADLSGAFLPGVSWFGDEATGENAVMAGAHFEHADLPGLNLKKAHLQGANFTDAVLVNADLSTVSSLDYSFQDTTFYQADLKGAKMSGANLDGASLDEAYVYAGAGQQMATIEVLDDPTKNPDQYRFYHESYSATMAPASTDNIVACPNGTRQNPKNDCGALTSDYWVTPAPPQEPTDCVLRQWQQGDKTTPDDRGMVLVCESRRHKKGE